MQEHERYHERNDQNIARHVGYTVTSAENAIKAAGLINGGAAVALLALIGNFADAETMKLVKGTLSLCLTIYVIGVAVSAFASGLAYFSNGCFAEAWSARKYSREHPYVHKTPKSEGWERAGEVFRVLAIIAILGSYVAFIVASWKAGALLTTLIQQ